ncbi:DNA-binding CsgD family transcriptional regulator/tetratricopeptide (TPR) repeat protein [Streptomyces olivoverticillatus]|uniref:DNA-binding CsgD family transcriptional regulator/tetratricopeptide (TPR) repeat protein n=1 Tax=Streptomyces olivoverticillatus TaxID=66427 RepID=A0A7W7LNK9_9ACTN|nr:DNA-binding CsgD family transcriptional regulator/tetratricopeptide (TPR) repeat protein [Streptomyces olivoverticillatus]
MEPQVTDERPPMRPPVDSGYELLERDEEQQLLRGLLRGLHAGRPALAEIHGAPGMGRSALLERAVHMAHEEGVHVATAQASQEETQLRYGVAAQLHAATGPLPGAEGLLRPARERDDLTAALCRAFLAAARERPLMLVVDDVQWADPHSLRWLQALARRLSAAPLMLLTSRSGATPGGPHDRIETGSLAEHTVARHTVTLAPLSAAGVGTVLARVLGGPADDAFREAAARATEGNPGVLHSVAGRFARHGWPARVDHLPHLTDSAAEAVRERAVRTLAVLPAELLEVLRAIAVCGRHGTLDMIAALAELRTVSARRALELLSGTGLLTGTEQPAFREPKAAEAVLAWLSANRREELYARAAEHAHRAAVPDRGLARMLLGARVLGTAWAVDVLRREAARRRSAREPAEAARLLQRALREPMPPHLRIATVVELAEAVLPSSPEACDRHLHQALLAPADADAGPSWVRAAELLIARGDVISAQPLIARVTDRTPVRPPERAALRALYWMAEHSQPEAAHALDRPPVVELPEHPTAPAEAGAAAWRAALLGRDITGTRELARLALAPGHTVPPAAQIAACHALVLTDDHADAHAGLDALLLRAEHTHNHPVAGVALLVTALAHLHQGRPEAASAALDRAQEVMPPHCWHPLMAPGPVALKTLVHLEQGDVATAERSVQLARAGSTDGGLAWAYLLYARGRVQLAVGRREEALADLLECGRQLLARQAANPAVLPWRSAAARACGPNDAMAAALLAEERRLALHWGAPGSLTRALYAGDEPGRPAGPEPSAPAGWQYRQALVALATAPLSAPDAIGPLLNADGTPAPERTALSVRPRRPDTRAPGPAPGTLPRGLTGAEQRVAARAASGMPNRAIAAELSVTPRTVELHLTKVYRKLGIQGRPELADALGHTPRETS